MRSAAQLLELAESHAISSAKAHASAEQAESKGQWGEVQAWRIEAGTLAETSIAFSTLASARAIYVNNEPTYLRPLPHEMPS